MKSRSHTRIASLSLAGLGFLVALAWNTNPAAAQGTQAQRDACTGDAMNLCGEFIPDEGRTGACLARKKAQLSPACRAVFSGSPSGKKAKVHKTRRSKAVKRRRRG